VFLLDGTGRASADSAMIFYNQPRHPSGAVELLHVESGAQFKIRLSKVGAEKIDLTLTIYDAEARRHTFNNLAGLKVRVCDAATGAELIRYEPAEDYSCETAIVLCELYRHGAQWKFHAIGSGFSGGLSALVRNYGLEVKEKKESITALIASKAKAEVKMLAALRGCTMSELVNDALLEYLEGHREELNDALTSRLK
ncbi:MAG: TerD family protein, partial [Selenomonadaceae bacterium]|nr:TerD family protein [Selenomonadaceae bacterium]